MDMDVFMPFGHVTISLPFPSFNNVRHHFYVAV